MPHRSEAGVECGDGPLNPADFAWQVTARAHRSLQKSLGDGYAATFRPRLQSLLCRDYYPATRGERKAVGISPVAAPDVAGGRGFKVRYPMPGGGKSGGLRLAVLALCAEGRIVVCDAFERKEEPQDREFVEAFATGSASDSTL